MEATVAERGQITLPKAVRDALGLTKGSVLKVELEGSRIVLRKSVDDAISRVRGKFALDADAAHARDGVVDTLPQHDPATFQLDLQHAALGQAQGVAHRFRQGDLAAFCNSGFHQRALLSMDELYILP